MPFLGTTTLAIVFIYFMVPETSDKTISEIQDEFRNERILDGTYATTPS